MRLVDPTPRFASYGSDAWVEYSAPPRVTVDYSDLDDEQPDTTSTSSDSEDESAAQQEVDASVDSQAETSEVAAAFNDSTVLVEQGDTPDSLNASTSTNDDADDDQFESESVEDDSLEAPTAGAGSDGQPSKREGKPRRKKKNRGRRNKNREKEGPGGSANNSSDSST